ncbi:MAG: VWA domain-containing protein [bacterium]|nr:VWA domain-containing protein [bacterium]
MEFVGPGGSQNVFTTRPNTRPLWSEASSRRRLEWLSIALLVGAVLFTASASAGIDNEQTNNEETQLIGGLSFKAMVELTVVNIDVFVRDEDGKRINTLTVDDFRVSQDGTVREITNFATYDQEFFTNRRQAGASLVDTPPASAQSSEPPPLLQNSYVVIFIDNQNLRQFDRNRVLSEVRDFVRQVMVPSVQVMVVTYQRSLDILQGFTANQQEVLAALREARTMVGARSERDSERTRILREIAQIAQKQTSTRDQRLRDADIHQRIRSFSDEYSLEIDSTIQAIRQVEMALGGFPGRKSFVYVSNGLPMLPGKDLVHELASVNQETPVLSMLVANNKKSYFKALASSASAQGITFYTIDATGVDVSTGVSAEFSSSPGVATFINMTNNQEPLELLAERTGGFSVLNTNNFKSGFERIQADLFTYFSIGYPINSAGGDRIHKIDIQLPDYPEYQLRYRRTFVEKSLTSEVQDRVVSSLLADPGDNLMNISLKLNRAAPTAEGRWILPVTVFCPVESVALLPEEEDFVGRVELYVALRDSVGRQSDIKHQTHEVRLPAAEYEARRQAPLIFDMKLLVEPGDLTIAVGLLDPVTRQSAFARTQTVVRGSY